MNKLQKLFYFILKNNILMLLFFCAVGIFLSLYFRYEMISDFNNYHYYLPWAFFNDRTFTDIALAMENSYHNPLVDMPYYFLVEYFNDNLTVYYTYTGLFFGILIFVFYKLCRLIFKPEQKIELLLTLIIAVTGFATLTQVGTCSNEILVSSGIMAGLYLVYKELFVLQSERGKIFAVAGYIMGVMLGLKLTAVIYCVASGCTLILFYKKLQTPVKTIGLFALGGFFGFLTVNGWWMFILYEHFGNPLFPYLNNIFKSPYYADKFLTYSDFYEKEAADYFLFPYKASFQISDQVTSEAEMLDVRLALGYTLLWITLIFGIFKKNLLALIKQHQNIVFLVVFSVISYALWLQIFSIIRYAIPFEMLIAVFIVLYFSAIRPQDLVKFALWASCCIILFFILLSGLPYASWGNRLGETKLVYDNNIKLPENSLLISLSPRTGLAATQIVKNNPDVKLANETSKFSVEGTKLHDTIEEYKRNSKYKAFLINLKSPVAEFDRYTPVNIIKGDNLEEIFENLQFIIKTELKPENFYCKDVGEGHSVIKTFLCIDKKDKDSIFPPVE